MTGKFLAILLASFLTVTGALAQGIPGLGSATPAEEPGAEATVDTSPANTDALIQLLRDDAAREELIRQLEAGAAATEGTQGDAAATGTAQDEAAPSLGQQVSSFAQSMADTLSVKGFSYYMQIKRVPLRLGNAIEAADPDLLIKLARELALMIAVTYSCFFLFRVISRALSRRLGRAAVGRRFLARLALAVVSSLLDAAVVILSALAALIVATFVFGRLGGDGEALAALTLPQSAYLSAFVSVEMIKVVFRFFLAPRLEQLRLLPMQTGAVKKVWSWMSISIVILGYGQLLLVPVVTEEVGFLSGYALTTVIGAVVILYTLVQVFVHRRDVAHWIHGTSEEARGKWTGILAGLWHWPATIYLVGLLFIVLIRPGNVLVPLLWATAQILAIILIWIFLRNWAIRLASRGVRLRDSTREMFPALERRVNSILPRLVLALRIAMLIGVVAALLEIMGILDLRRLIGADGLDVTAEVVTVIFILVASILAWLAIASWVDFRLNPSGRRTPSSRETTLLTLLYNAATIAIVIFASMFILSELGINIGPLIASAGVLGLAIGFGSQKLVQDIITGIFIQFDNAINVGDVVSLGGITGAVEKLTIRSVSLRDVEGAFHIIPFSSVDVVTNYMRDFSYFVCDMGVAYRENTEEVRQAMLDAYDKLREDPEMAEQVLGDLEWFGLQAFGDNAVVLRARIKTIPGKQWGVGRAYNGIVKTIFDERGIEIPFPHQTIYFGVDREGNAPPLHIRRDGAEG